MSSTNTSVRKFEDGITREKLELHLFVPFDVFDRQIENGLAVDNASVVDQDRGFANVFADLFGDASNVLGVGDVTDVAINIHYNRVVDRPLEIDYQEFYGKKNHTCGQETLRAVLTGRISSTTTVMWRMASISANR